MTNTHSQRLIDGTLPPTKLMKIKCELCNYQDQPQTFKSNSVLASIFNKSLYVCPHCNKNDHLKKILNNFSETSIKQSINWVGKTKTIIVVLIFLGLSSIHYYFGEYKNQRILIDTNKADELMEAGAGADAAQLFIKAANEAILDEDKVILLTNAGYAYLEGEMIEQALVEFEKAKKYAKTNSAEYELLVGEIAYAKGQFEEALTHFQAAYEKNPRDFQINTALGILYLGLDEGSEIHTDYNKALQHLQIAHDSGERKTTTQQHLAIGYFMLKDYDKALELFIETDTQNDPAVQTWIGMSYAGKGDMENAKLYLEKATATGYITSEDMEGLLIPIDEGI